MEIQKYKANILNSNKQVIGYISEIRHYCGNGVYNNETDYVISVTSKSMPNGNYGTFKIDPKTIIKIK